MIITRSPLRVSFAGGGTDLPAFYEKYGPGMVVSTAINKHVYVTLSEKFDGRVSVRYRVHENVERSSDLKHPLIRECLLHYGIESGVEIVVISDVPARGSGLGASSALCAALCLAIEVFKGWEHPSPGKLAQTASMIEIERCGSPIGKQDHYASVFGGMNGIIFNLDGSVDVTPVEKSSLIEEIEEQSLLFYLDRPHEYKDRGTGFVQSILHDQVREIPDKMRIYKLQRDNAERMMENIGYEVMERFQDHINENWRLKRQTHQDISCSEIDNTIARAYSAGATAAKVCGAGGGGFLYLIVPPSMQGDVRRELSDLKELKFGFDWNGTKVIWDGGVQNGAHVR